MMALLTRMRYKALISLVYIYFILLTGMTWLWGGLLLLWGIMDLLKDETWLTESVHKTDNPILYYLIVITWLVAGIYLISQPFIY